MNMITVSKEELAKKYRTGFSVEYNDFGIHTFTPRRTSITEVFFNISESKDPNTISDFDGDDDCDVYDLNAEVMKEMADRMYKEKLIAGIKRLEEMFGRFPTYKSFLYSLNIGNSSKIEYAKNNKLNLETAKKMLSGELPLPAKRLFLMPENFTLPSFIPEIGKVMYRSGCERNTRYYVDEYKVENISLHFDHEVNSYDATLDVYKEDIIKKKDAKIYVNVTLRKINGRETISLNNKDLCEFEDGTLTENTFSALSTTKEGAIKWIQNYGDSLIKLIENSLAKIEV